MDGPVVMEAREALTRGDVAPLLKWVRADDEATIRQAKEHAGDNVEASREYVEAYVDLTHYVEALHQTAARGAAAHREAPAGGHEH